jgi:hypothetical protein
MEVLQSMGFTDVAVNAAALERHNGDIYRSVHDLLSAVAGSQ